MDNPDTTGQPAGSQSLLPAQVKKRPWSVTLLAVIVLIITIINFIRFVLSLRYWVFLSSVGAVSPLYLALTGLVWSIAGGILLWGLWTAKAWAPRLMQAVGLSFALYYWLDQVFLKDHPLNGTSGALHALLPTNWPFAAFVTIAGLALMVWVLSRQKVRVYFSQ